MIYCYDCLQLYDVIKVIHGLKAGRRGHVLEIRPNGYLTVKEVVQVGSVKDVSTGLRWAFNIYLFVSIGGAPSLPKRLLRFRGHS